MAGLPLRLNQRPPPDHPKPPQDPRGRQPPAVSGRVSWGGLQPWNGETAI